MRLTPAEVIFILVLILFAVLILSRRRRKPEPNSELPEYKACPYCAEPIRVEARVCKHCGRNLAAKGSER